MDFTLPNGQYPHPGALRAQYGARMAEYTADGKLRQRVLLLFARRMKFALGAMPDAKLDAATQRPELLQGMGRSSAHCQAPSARDPGCAKGLLVVI